MSQKDDLLDAAKKCLREKGYARTTARDLTAISGANLSSIGYHFGSKDELMLQAMVELMTDWGASIADAAGAIPRGTTKERFAARLGALLDILQQDEGLSIANFEAFAQLARSAELKSAVRAQYDEARLKLVEAYLPEIASLPEPQRQAVGALLLAMIPGLMAQVLVGADSMLDASLLSEAFSSIGAALSI